jgi:hypothetical protein
MASRRKQVAKAVPFNPADLSNITKANPYLQRLIEDADLRDNVRAAVDSSKSAYNRLSNGKAPAKALLEDKKLQGDLRDAFEAARDASLALNDAPKRSTPRKGLSLGRLLLLLIIGGVAAVAGSEQLRSKVLDTLFGAEEEFQYTPPPSTAPAPPTTPVSAA